MVSTHTPSNGARHQNNTLIFQLYSAKHHTKLATQMFASPFGKATLLTRFVFVFLFLSISFLVKLNAQCSPRCGEIITIQLNSSANGSTPLSPQDFYTGTCTAVSISPTTVDCSDIGTLVTLTLTSDGMPQCMGNDIRLDVVDNVRPTLTCPQDAIVDCAASTLSSAIGMATAIDNCTPSSSIMISESDATVTSSTVGVCDTIRRTWMALDANSNVSTCVQNIIVSDSNAPTLVFTAGAPPADTTVNCMDILPPVVGFSGTDDCGTPTSSVAGTPVGQGTDPNMCDFYSFTMNRVYSVTDNCGNTDQYTQVITINDTIAPIIPAQGTPSTVSPPAGSCQATVSLTVSATDNCVPATNLQGFYVATLQSTGDTITNGNGLNASGVYDVGIYDIEFTVIDPCGNFSSEIYVLDVIDASNPTARCRSAVNISVDSQTGASVITTASINDNSDDNCTPSNLLALSVARNDNGTDTLTCTDLGGAPITVTLTVTDANNNSNTCTSDVTATASNPTAICTNISVDLDATGNYNLNDAANVADSVALTSQFADVCNGPLTFAFSQTTFGCNNIGANTITVTATNTAAMSSMCTATVSVNDVTPPIMSCRPNLDAFLDESGQITIDPQWLISGAHEMFLIGGDDNNFITPGGITAYNLISPNSTTFSFQWDYETEDNRGAFYDYLAYFTPTTGWVDLAISTSTAPASGSVNVTLAAGEEFRIWLISRDNIGGRGRARLHSFSTSLASQGDLYLDNWQRVLVRSDGDAFISGSSVQSIDCTDAENLTFSASPNLLTCDDISTSPNTVTLTVTDSVGNSSMCTTDITVSEMITPEFECADFSAQLDSNGDIIVEPGWFLEGPRSFYLETLNNGNYPMSGSVDYFVRVRTAGVLSFRWDFESSDTTNTGEVFGVVVNGSFLPLSDTTIHTNVLQSVPVNVGDVLGFVIESDNNSFDAYANVRPVNFTLTNDYDPVLWTRTVDNNNGTSFIHGDLTDNCTTLGDLDLTINGLANLVDSCSSPSPVAVIIEITDVSGNSSTCNANLSIIDNEPPIAVCPSSYSVTLGSNGQVDLTNLPATIDILGNSVDNCGVDSVTTSPMVLTCADIGPNTISYTVIDAAGNTATCTNVVTAQEGTAPQITCPADIIVQCENLPADTMATNAGMATAADNCSATMLSYSDLVTSMVPTLTLPDCQTIERTWMATDASGNISDCVQQITIQDNIAPTLTAPTGFMATMSVDCGSVPSPSLVTATDNCTGEVLTLDTLDSRFIYDANGMVIDTIAGSEVGMSGHYNYNITRTWTVVDACGNAATMSQMVNVSDAQGPTVNFPSSLIRNTDPGTCDAILAGVGLKAGDLMDCADAQFLTITNDSPFAISNGADASGTYPLGTTTVTFTITDPSGNVTNHPVVIEIIDVETPNMNCEDDFTIVLSSAGAASISVLNIDEGSNDACGLASLSIDPTNFDCADLGFQIVTLTGVDNNGNIGTCTTMVEVTTNATSSVTISCPADVTVACPTMPMPPVTGTALFTTACGNGSVSFIDDVSPAPSCGTIIRTWTATDGTNSQSCMQTITTVDNNAPTLVSTVPRYPIIECDVPPVDLLTYEDDCRGNFTVTPVDDTLTIGGFAFVNDPTMCGYYNFNITRTWTAIDDCGNVAVPETAGIGIRDTEAPVINIANPLIIATDNNNCSASINLDLRDFVDDCADDANLDFTLDGIAGNSIISGVLGLGAHSFNLEVVDPCGNTTGVVPINIMVEDQQTPSAVCIQSLVIVLDNTGNATVNPNDVDAGSTDNCTATPDLLLSVAPSAFTNADIGPIQVTLTVEDEAGLTNTCVASGTVVGGVVFDAGEVSIAANGTGTLPVHTLNFQNVTSFSFDIDVVYDTVAMVTNLININPDLTANGTFTPTATANGYSVTWNATTTSSPVSLADSIVLFELDLAGVGMVGEMSAVNVSNDTVTLLIGGTVTSSSSASIGGNVTIFNPITTQTFNVIALTEEGLPVANATVAQSGATVDSDTTDATGIANFTEALGMTTTFTPEKLTGWKEGVTTNDAFLVLTHPNPTSIFSSGYKNIAADADRNDLITGNDAILIFQLAVDPAFTAIPNNTSWRFIHENPDLSNVNTPWGLFSESFTTTVTADDTVNFVGVKVGDIDATADPSLRGGLFEFTTDNQYIDNANVRVEIPFKAKDFIGINGYQFTIDFETKFMEYVDMIPGALPNLNSFNFKDAKIEDGQLTTGWLSIDPVDLNNEEVLFTLVFESKLSDFALEDVLTISDNLIPMEVIEQGGNLKNEIDLVFNSGTSSTSNSFGTSLELRQNIPNPFNEETVIGFTLPGASDILLTFMDASGKLLHNVDANYQKGYHEVKVDKSVLPTTGVVFYQLQTAFGTKVRKMIILK